MTRLVVRHYNPAQVVLVALAVLAGLGAIGWSLFEYGRAKAGIDYLAARKAAETLQVENQKLHETINGLREQLAILERSHQIEREAYRHLEGNFTGLQDEISELQSELAFYRGIVTPKDAAGGLRVQGFEVGANGLERGWRYKLVLTQVLKNDTVARGRVEVLVEGTQGDRLTVLNLIDLLGNGSKDLTFRFKYFQNFEGDFQLPEGFIPARVIVKLNPRDQRHQDVEKVFGWPA